VYDALLALIRNSLGLLDGTQKWWAAKKAIELERRIMQADLDEQNKESDSQQTATTTATPPDDGNKNGGGNQPAAKPAPKPGSGVAGGVGAGFFGFVAQGAGLAGGLAARGETRRYESGGEGRGCIDCGPWA
jgi:hypothetical protein